MLYVLLIIIWILAGVVGIFYRALSKGAIWGAPRESAMEKIVLDVICGPALLLVYVLKRVV